MPRFRMVVLALVILATVAAACGGGGGTTDDVGEAPTSSPSATTPAVPTSAPGTTVPAATLTLRITDLHLANSEESDNGVRVLLPAGVASASVTIAGLPSPNRVILVCQAKELDRRLSTGACRTPATGADPVMVTLGNDASGVEIVQVGVSGSGPAGNSTTLSEVTIRYAAPTREVNVRLPQIEAGESGGRPTFGLTPASSTGAYRATLTWSVIQVFGGTPSNARLELVQGTSTTNQAEGTGLEVRLNGNVPSPTPDPAFRVQNIGSAAMVNPKLALLLP